MAPEPAQIAPQGVQPPSPPAPASPDPLGGAPEGIPDPLAAVTRGEPPAVRVPDPQTASEDPIANYIETHLGDLVQAGLDVYEAMTVPELVVYNPSVISYDDLQAADEQGTLAELVPELNQLASLGPEMPAPAAPPATIPAGRPTGGQGGTSHARAQQASLMAGTQRGSSTGGVDILPI